MTATPTGGISYSWTNGSNTENTTDWNYITSLSGKFKVIVTDSNGCVSKASSNSVVTKANPIPLASINVIGSTTISSTGSVKLNAMPSNGVSWQWYKDGSPIPNATNKQLFVTAGGSYSVAVTKTGCTGYSTEIAIIQTTPKQETGTTSGSFEIIAYPNPVGDELTVDVTGITNATNATIEVMNSIGQSVTVKEMMSTFNCQIQTTNWASGIYFVRYKDNEGRTGTIKINKD
jgi:hypothetical protein